MKEKKKVIQFEVKLKKVAEEMPEGCGIIFISPEMNPSWLFKKTNRRLILGSLVQVQQELLKDDIMRTVEENFEKITNN